MTMIQLYVFAKKSELERQNIKIYIYFLLIPKKKDWEILKHFFALFNKKYFFNWNNKLTIYFLENMPYDLTFGCLGQIVWKNAGYSAFNNKVWPLRANTIIKLIIDAAYYAASIILKVMNSKSVNVIAFSKLIKGIHFKCTCKMFCQEFVVYSEIKHE